MRRVLGRCLGWLRSFAAARVNNRLARPEKLGFGEDIELHLIHHFYSRYHPIVLDNTAMDDSKRNVLDRLELIKQNLSGSNCLDIGCGAGFFSFNIARLGYWVTGIDRDRIILKKANLIKKKYDVPNVEFRYCSVDEESVAKFPVFDNILYLSIHHHIIEVYGFERATRIFRALAAKTGKRLFFDFPYPQDIQGKPQFREIPPMGDDPDSWLENYLKEAGFKNIIRAGVFTHSEKQHEKRQLFIAER